MDAMMTATALVRDHVEPPAGGELAALAAAAQEVQGSPQEDPPEEPPQEARREQQQQEQGQQDSLRRKAGLTPRQSLAVVESRRPACKLRSPLERSPAL